MPRLWYKASHEFNRSPRRFLLKPNTTAHYQIINGAASKKERAAVALLSALLVIVLSLLVATIIYLSKKCKRSLDSGASMDGTEGNMESKSSYPVNFSTASTIKKANITTRLTNNNHSVSSLSPTNNISSNETVCDQSVYTTTTENNSSHQLLKSRTPPNNALSSEHDCACDHSLHTTTNGGNSFYCIEDISTTMMKKNKVIKHVDNTALDFSAPISVIIEARQETDRSVTSFLESANQAYAELHPADVGISFQTNQVALQNTSDYSASESYASGLSNAFPSRNTIQHDTSQCETESECQYSSALSNNSLEDYYSDDYNIINVYQRYGNSKVTKNSSDYECVDLESMSQAESI